jgi:hypothetical protein
MLGLFFPYGIVLQALAVLHFARRRPDTFWLWVILIGGGLGALVYIVAEVIPDLRLLPGVYEVYPRRKRIRQLQAQILDNPSIGNFEELGDLYLDDGQFANARDCLDRVVGRSDDIDPRYRRALAAIGLDDFPAAAADLEAVTARDPRYDYQRAAGLYAHALARLGRRDEADAQFRSVLETSTLSETEYNYASFLAATGRVAEARELLERILRKKKTMPDYVKRRERRWFRRAALLKKRVSI